MHAGMAFMATKFISAACTNLGIKVEAAAQYSLVKQETLPGKISKYMEKLYRSSNPTSIIHSLRYFLLTVFKEVHGDRAGAYYNSIVVLI